MLGGEVQNLIEGWIYVLLGLFGGLFVFGLGALVAAGAFGAMLIIGIVILVETFITYQWPNRHEYIEFWRNQWTH